MATTIHWTPELGVYSVHDGTNERVVTPDELADGQKLAPLRPMFEEAHAAVESGLAANGVHV